MATEMISHWPVRVSLPLGDGDRDADGFLTDEGTAGLLARLRDAYLADCTTLVDVAVEVDGIRVERGNVPAPGDGVSASIAVVEVFPDHFTMTARIRPGEGPGIAAAASCRVRPSGGVTREVQAELIARAQGARHLH